MNAHDRRKKARELKRYRRVKRTMIDCMRTFLKSPCPARVYKASNGDIIHEANEYVTESFDGQQMTKYEVKQFLRRIQEPNIPLINYEGDWYKVQDESLLIKELELSAKGVSYADVQS